MKKVILGLCGLMLVSSTSFADVNADYLAAATQWSVFKSLQPKACAAEVDSTEVLVGHPTDISVLILHGYSENPQAMQEYVEFFKQYDVNILVPRLAHHFDTNLQALDTVRAADWTSEAQQAFSIARHLGKHVVVVGYSLGGLIAAHLSLTPGDNNSIAALVLLAPALRLSANMEEAAMVGSLFTKTGNEWLKMAPPSCGTAHPYISVNGGGQVVRLVRSSDHLYPGIDGSDWKKIFAVELDSSRPVLMAVASNDEVVDTGALNALTTPKTSQGYMTYLVFNADKSGGRMAHSTFTLPGAITAKFNRAASTTPYAAGDLFGQMKSFMARWVGLNPMPAPVPAQ